MIERIEGGLKEEGVMHPAVARAILALIREAEQRGMERAAHYLDGYAGGHYMAQSCASAIRAEAAKLGDTK